MALSRTALSGPSANASGSVTITYSVAPTTGNLLLLNVFALSGQTFPGTIAGWTTNFTNGSGGGFVSAQYQRYADGTEGATQVVMTATVASVAWITEFNASTAGFQVTSFAGVGGDASDASDGMTTTSGSLTTQANNWITADSVWASSTPSFPTAPGVAGSRTLTQSGATLGTIQNRASSTWLTNHRYNQTDIPVTTGASAAIAFSTNSGTTNLRGITNFSVLSETSLSTPVAYTHLVTIGG